MSFRDKLRDELYGDGPEAELKSEQEAAKYDELLNDNEDQWTAARYLLIWGLVDAGLFAAAWLAPRFVSSSLSYGQALPYIILLIAGTGFMIAFRGCRMLRKSRSQNAPPADGVIASAYADDLEREGRFTNWLVGAAGAVINLIVFFVLISGR